MIGSLGEVAFKVSSDKVFTFNDFSRKGSARITAHELIGRKPLVEFVGPGLESISFKMMLSTFLGIVPLDEVNTLREMRDKGTASSLSLDGTPVGDGLWLLESINEDWKHIDNNGSPRVIDCDLQLKEYVEAKDGI